MSIQEATMRDNNALLDVRGLKKHFPILKGVIRHEVGRVKAVDGIDLFVRHGETLGLVGESGCGKTTTGRLIVRALAPTAGDIFFKANGTPVNLAELTQKEMKTYRRHLQMIFQDPYSSLNPRMTILDIVGEPLIVNGVAHGTELEDRVKALLEHVGLKVEYMRRYPHAFSGGQRQRIGIARALALNPKLIVCDEPVSALDVSIQAQVLNLLADLQDEFDLSYLFVAHDLSVVRHISDRVAVMYVGKLVEMSEKNELFGNPKHPYTEALLGAVPVADPRRDRSRYVLTGEVANPSNPPSGCIFHPRCKYAKEICKNETPPLREVANGHFAACHFSDTLDLRGVK